MADSLNNDVNKEALDYTSKRPSIESIINHHADKNRFASEDIISHKRRADIAEVRVDAIVEVYSRRRDLSLTDIGIAFGGRNYATIRTALEKRGISLPTSGVIYREAVIADAKEGFTPDELAHRHHCSNASIRKILYEAKVPFKS
ncbi:helix-turn-helix domain-containing protein [Phyllobacterium myrsinacearum]|uniref:TPP-dependent indolepyruvate ferredoxin oxidoreductase alpha subunit n=1 Tax=Phyllobacterium myrsinacearum TaxID=28101 RepID=A0A839EU11_9HYPH|nr:helix-turn-helix domain-containing protein [Phyllobacterium myrsinacearum]MBA8881668.1 TPP-dependent indolepyruvate ferredoxin oxidoreductase alpha subunit [Phyllobacterium myrsinacearum]